MYKIIICATFELRKQVYMAQNAGCVEPDERPWLKSIISTLPVYTSRIRWYELIRF